MLVAFGHIARSFPVFGVITYLDLCLVFGLGFWLMSLDFLCSQLVCLPVSTPAWTCVLPLVFHLWFWLPGLKIRQFLCGAKLQVPVTSSLCAWFLPA